MKDSRKIISAVFLLVLLAASGAGVYLYGRHQRDDTATTTATLGASEDLGNNPQPIVINGLESLGSQTRLQLTYQNRYLYDVSFVPGIDLFVRDIDGAVKVCWSETVQSESTIQPQSMSSLSVVCDADLKNIEALYYQPNFSPRTFRISLPTVNSLE